MIDEKYRRNPENITDFLKKERFRYIKIFERLVNDKLYEEYEQCDFILEKIEDYELIFIHIDHQSINYALLNSEKMKKYECLKILIILGF